MLPFVEITKRNDIISILTANKSDRINIMIQRTLYDDFKIILYV